MEAKFWVIWKKGYVSRLYKTPDGREDAVLVNGFKRAALFDEAEAERVARLYDWTEIRGTLESMTSAEYNRNRYNIGTGAAQAMAQAARIAQARLGLTIDGKWGPKSQLAAALDRSAEFPDRQPTDDFVAVCESQIGKPYVFGAVARCDDPSPPAFDCQELIRWAACRLGVKPSAPDGSWRMLQHCADHGLLIDIETARGIPGVLLYSCSAGEFPEAPWGDRRPASSHVAISMGDGRTIEARPSNGNAVGYQPFSGRGWRYAALIPGLAYS